MNDRRQQDNRPDAGGKGDEASPNGPCSTWHQNTVRSALSDHLVVILVAPRSPGNIGMTARAMANFGVAELRLVAPCDHLGEEARRLAVGAGAVLDRAAICPDLPTALADCRWTVATTRRHGRRRGPVLEAGELATRLPVGGGDRVALVFGREDAGLTSDEVGLCSHSATISAGGPQASLNLAQAVLIFLYELSRPRAGLDRSAAAGPAQSELAPFFDQVGRVLERIGFLNPHRPEHVLTPLRRILRRGIGDSRELALARALFSRLEASVNDWRGPRRGDENRRKSS